MARFGGNRCDNYPCQDCGEVQRRPAARFHHIRSRRLFRKDNRSANARGNLIRLSGIWPAMQIGTVYTTLRTASGQIKVPNAELASQTIMVSGGQGDTKSQR